MTTKSLISLSVYFLSLLAFASADNNNITAYDSFVDCLSGKKLSESEISGIIFTPNSPSFTTVLQSYIRNRRFNLSTTPKPTRIVTPTTVAEVSAAVVCAKRSNLHLKIRSGGHDYEGLSYVSASDFVILDMFNFRDISVDLSDESAWVGAGAQLGELFYRIWEKSPTLAFPAGVCPTVGVGGHVSGGGYGTLLRKHGLTVDHVVDAKIVVSNGAVLDRKSMGEDLFWAIRGGGGASFGVVLSYKIKLVPVPPKVTVFRLEQYMSENASRTVHQYQEIVPTMDHDLFVRILLQPVTRNRTRTLRTTFIGMFLGEAERLLKITDSIFPTLGLTKSGCQEMRWIDSVLYWANFDNTTAPNALLSRTPDSVNFLKRKSDYVKSPISVPDIETIFNKMIEIGRVGLVFNSYGGRMNEISESETPMPHRAGNLYKIQYSINWNEEGEEVDRDNINQIRKLYSFMKPYVSKNPREAYFNYRDLDIGTNDHGKNSYSQGKVYGVKYFKGNFDRLVRIKTKVDPDNFFRNEQSIPTSRFRARKAGK